KFRNQLPVINGGMIMPPNDGHSGISLVASPVQFFAHLRNIAPSVKRVFTVYNEKNSGWLIRIAEEEALKSNIELQALEASNIRQAARHFKTILSIANTATDAVWLLLDKVVPDQSILPLVLDAAWKKNLVLFSNNPADTKRGALFSLFPDYEKMGYSLAEFSKQQINSNTPLVLPLSSLKVSVNERTASHLGLNYSSNQRESFDLIYPIK
ncbi:MAG TPA: ABC transporter substrate-binding protein, partial [Oceanospirillales bacterium]|nr:ABC transporter substrate-binding protein [Oceanospirillales bacterium]